MLAKEYLHSLLQQRKQEGAESQEPTDTKDKVATMCSFSVLFVKSLKRCQSMLVLCLQFDLGGLWFNIN